MATRLRHAGQRMMLMAGNGPRLAFTGSTTLAEDFSGVIGTLVVLNDPLGLYDTFEETTDADNKFTLDGDEISGSGFDYETKTSHVAVYTASGTGVPDLTYTLTVTITDVWDISISIYSPADDATDVAVDADLVLTFASTVNLGASGTINLKLASDDSTVESWDVATEAGTGAGQVSVVGGTALTMRLTSDLDPGVAHYVVYDAGVVTSPAGASIPALSSKTTWNFTTVSDSWAPTDLGAALLLWIDPSDATTVFQSNAGTTAAAVNNDPVGYIADKSGRNFHLTSAADDTTRPTLQGVGGNPALRFDGSNDILRRLEALGAFAAGSASIFVAVKANPAVDTDLLAEGYSGANNPRYSIRANASTASTAAIYIRGDGGTADITGASSITANAFDNTDNVFGFTDSGTEIKTYLDGTLVDTDSYTRLTSATKDRFALCGKLGPTAGSYFAADVYGVVAVSGVLSDADRASLVTYLGAKMGRSL